MEREIRLLFVMNTPTTGGAERHTFDLGRAMRAEGFTPTIFAMKAGCLSPPDDVRLLQPDVGRGLARRIGDLVHTIRAECPDVVVAVNQRPVLAACLARGLAWRHPPIVAIWHTTVLRGRREEGMQLAYTPLYNRVEEVVFISENQRRFWRERGVSPRGEAVILNGVDLERFSPGVRASHRERVRAELGLAPDDVVLGVCAVMRPEKNHVQLVDAVARLRADGYPARMLFVGDGPTRAVVEARARDLAVADHAIFAGMQSDVRPYVAAFDVGVLCSVAVETLSLSALEAMGMGVPMVMSDIGGASEIVDGANGRLFPVGDTMALREALLAFTDADVRKRAGHGARAAVEERFDQRRMNRSYAALFRRLAASGQPRGVA